MILDKELIGYVIQRAKEAVENKQLPFYALLAHKGRILVEAENSVLTDNDITCHSVMNVIRRAGRELSQEVLKKSVLYASSEPCAMCSGAIYWAGVSRVVFGCSGKALQQIAGQSISVNCQDIFNQCHPIIEAVGPVEEELASELIMEFWPHPS